MHRFGDTLRRSLSDLFNRVATGSSHTREGALASTGYPLGAGFIVGCLILHHQATLPSNTAIAVLGVTGLAVFVVAPGRGLLRLSAICCLAYCWAGWQAGQGLAARLHQSLEGEDIALVGWIASVPQTTSRGVRFLFHITDCPGVDVYCPRGNLVRLSWSRGFSRSGQIDEASLPSELPSLRPGERWHLNARLRLPVTSVNPGLFDAELRLLEEGVVAIGSVRRARAGDFPNERLNGWHFTLRTAFETVRQAGIEALERALSQTRDDARGVLLALAFGDQSAISSRDWEVFNHTGVSHLMSISGLHITMLAAMAGGLARWILSRRAVARSGALLHVCAPSLQWGFAIAVAFTYAGLAGWGIPAQRTCWMLAVTAWALTRARQRAVAEVLSLAAAVVCFVDPWAPLAAGFWLSFATVGAIVLFSSAKSREPPANIEPPPVSSEGGSIPYCRPSVLPTWPGYGASKFNAQLASFSRIASEALRTQWAATLALLPLGALFFSTLSLVGPLANAFAIPLVSVFVTPAVLFLGIVSQPAPALAQWIAPLVGTPVEWLLDALRAMSEWPLGVMVLAAPDGLTLALATAAVFMLLRPGPVAWRFLWSVGLLPLLLKGPDPVNEGGFRLSALDVGQGMAVLIETRSFRLLYDTGPAWDEDTDAGARVIVPWLRSKGISKIDAVIVSHADIDHSGGLASVIRLIDVATVYSSLASDHPIVRALPNHRACRRGDTWHWNSLTFRFLHPGEEFPPGAARSPTNAVSCVLQVGSPAGTALLAGDIESRQEAALVERFGPALRADVLLVPHHGSNTSSSPGFLAAVSPSIALIQAGYRNRFRHPTGKVLSRYEALSATILRTDLHGAIELSFDPSRPSPQLKLGRFEPMRYWRVIPEGSYDPRARAAR